MLTPENIEIAVLCSNDYLDQLNVFAFLFNKFYSEKKEVNVFGFEKKPKNKLPNNFSFNSLGVQRGINYWIDDVKNVIDKINGEYFILVVENDFLIRDFNHDVLSSFLKIINNQKFKKIDKVDLTTSSSIHSYNPENIIFKNKNHEIFELSEKANYRMAVGHFAIWRKEYLLKYLRSFDGYNTTPWHFEIASCQLAKKDNARIIASKGRYAAYFIDSVVKNQSKKFFDLDGINKRSSFGLGVEKSVINEMINLKMIKKHNNGLYKLIQYKEILNE